jgi:hypothetical protein
LYLLFAALAITASLGFSRTAIYKSTAESSDLIVAIEQDMKLVEEAETALRSAKDAQAALLDDSDKILAEARVLAARYEAERLQAQNALNTYWVSGRDSETNTWREGFSQAEYQTIIEERANATALRDQARTNVADIENGNAPKRAQERVDDAQKKYNETTTLLGTSIQLNARLRDAKTEERQKQGAAIMFTLIMESFGKEEYTSQFRFAMLMFASSLLELLIFMFSPAVQVDRKMLSRVRRFLPFGIDVDELIKSFDAENSKFSFNDQVKLSREDKKKMRQMAEQMAENTAQKLKERYDKETDQLKSEVERYTELRTESENSYRGLLEAHKSEVNDLKKKIAELEKEPEEPRRRRTVKEAESYPVSSLSIDNTGGRVDEPIEKHVVRKKAVVVEEPKKVDEETTPEVHEDQATESIEKVVEDNTEVVSEEPTVETASEKVEVTEEQVETIEKTDVVENETETIKQVEVETPLASSESFEQETPRFSDFLDGIVEPEKTLVVEMTRPETATVVDKTEDKKETAPKTKYRFGECTEKIKNKFVSYVTEIVGDNGRGEKCEDLRKAAVRASLTRRQKEVFDQRLFLMTVSGTPLLRETEEGIVNDFTLREIIDYTTAVVA